MQNAGRGFGFPMLLFAALVGLQCFSRALFSGNFEKNQTTEQWRWNWKATAWRPWTPGDGKGSSAAASPAPGSSAAASPAPKEPASVSQAEAEQWAKELETEFESRTALDDMCEPLKVAAPKYVATPPEKRSNPDSGNGDKAVVAEKTLKKAA